MSFNCPKCTILCDINMNSCNICGTIFDSSIFNNINEANNSQKIIDENYIKAYQTIPEYFFPKKLFYLMGRINNIPTSFLIDTGAMVSVMSYEVMENLNLNSILDRKYCGKMLGVGTKNLEGKLHYVEILFDFGFVPASFSVIKGINTIILGMDFIQSHGLILDFKNQMVTIGNNKLKMNL